MFRNLLYNVISAILRNPRGKGGRGIISWEFVWLVDWSFLPNSSLTLSFHQITLFVTIRRFVTRCKRYNCEFSSTPGWNELLLWLSMLCSRILYFRVFLAGKGNSFLLKKNALDFKEKSPFSAYHERPRGIRKIEHMNGEKTEMETCSIPKRTRKCIRKWK